MQDLNGIFRVQNEYYESGRTLIPSVRKKSLKNLLAVIAEYGTQIESALYDDLRKSRFESYVTETAIVTDEIKFILRRISKLTKNIKVKTPLAHFKASSFIHPEPYGRVLIISPWNYPFQLCMAPLAGAVAAGNCVIVKPSELSPNTSRIIQKIVSESFDPGHAIVVTGGREVSSALLDMKHDFIFYTGGEAVGKIVMKKASENLTPVALELGGKSPCIVDETADIELTAKRITWGKFVNAGQTCVAPDYLLVHENMRDHLCGRIIHYIKKFYGNDPFESPDYPRIINDSHTQRLISLMKDCRIIYGGEYDVDNRYISPTLIDSPGWDSRIMQDEIFGPILPVETYVSLEEAAGIIKSRAKPLSLYLFTRNRKACDYIINTVSFGGGAVNDTVIHAASPELPFGGVGMSGTGSYHGDASFRMFTHYKSVMKKSFFPEINLRYPPYSEKKLSVIRKIIG